jgi:hypothetical protein
MGRFLDQAIVDYRLPIVSNKLQTTNVRLQIVTNKLKLLLVPLLQQKRYRHKHSPGRQAGWTDRRRTQAGSRRQDRQADRKTERCTRNNFLSKKRQAPTSEEYKPALSAMKWRHRDV